MGRRGVELGRGAEGRVGSCLRRNDGGGAQEDDGRGAWRGWRGRERAGVGACGGGSVWGWERAGWGMGRRGVGGVGGLCRLVAMAKEPCVYILASRRNGTTYVGVTSDLARRVWMHKEGLIEGFSKRYGVDRLVWYEFHGTMAEAITREKRLKRWKRDWKLRLIGEANPSWRDLYEELG